MATLWFIPVLLKLINILSDKMENSSVFSYKTEKPRRVQTKLNLLPFPLPLLSLKQNWKQKVKPRT